MARQRRGPRRAPARPESGAAAGLTRRAKVIAAGLASIVAAWAVSYFGPGIWSQARDATGRDPLQVTVLHPDEFDSMVEADHVGQLLWPADAPGIRDRAADLLAGRGSLPSDEEARAQGAFDASTTLFRLQLRAATDEPVTIHQFAVLMQDRERPVAGYWFTGDQGGLADVSYLSVSLDDEKVVWLDPVSGRESRPRSLEVTRSDLELVDVLARATDCACTWRLELTYSTADGERGRLAVGPGEGGPFRTTGLGAAATVRLPNGCTPPAGSPDLCAGLPLSRSG